MPRMVAVAGSTSSAGSSGVGLIRDDENPCTNTQLSINETPPLEIRHVTFTIHPNFDTVVQFSAPLRVALAMAVDHAFGVMYYLPFVLYPSSQNSACD